MRPEEESEELDDVIDDSEEEDGDVLEEADSVIPLKSGNGKRKSFASILMNKVRNDEDCFVLVTGQKGKGKSRFMVAVGEAVDKKFTLKRNMIFNATVASLKEKTYSLPDYSLIPIDELIGLAHKNEALSKQMTALGRLIATARKHHKITMGASPYFFELPKSLRDNYVDAWVHIVDRGHAALMLPDPSPFNKKDRWFMEETMKAWSKRLKDSGTGSVSNDEIIERLRLSPAFVGEIFYDDFPPEQKKEYLDLVFAAEEEALKAEGESAMVESSRLKEYAQVIARLMADLYLKGNYTQTQIAETAKVAQSTVTAMLKSVGITAKTKKQQAEEEKLIREAVEAMPPIQLSQNSNSQPIGEVKL